MLPEKQIKEIRKELDSCARPIIFFDDDADGLSSFLLFYRYLREGKGICVKATPNIDHKYIKKVLEYQPDKIFVLDVAQIEQDFIDAVKIPIIWIDHHGPYERQGNIKYYNPRLIKEDLFIPTTRMCYEVVKQDMWIAFVGCVGDYYLPEFYDEMRKRYTKLVGKAIKADEVYFTTKIGELVNLFSFIMKGKVSDTMKYVKTMTRINEPNEILEQTTPQGKYVYKKYMTIKKQYDDVLEPGLKVKPENGFLIYIYHDNKMSFTSEISNELLFRNPKKVIIVGREKNGEYKMSIRTKDKKIPEALTKSLSGLEGYGGGHENACGVNIKKIDFDVFVQRLSKYLT